MTSFRVSLRVPTRRSTDSTLPCYYVLLLLCARELSREKFRKTPYPRPRRDTIVSREIIIYDK